MDQIRTDHMFELLNDLQSSRLNDQRTNMPRNTTTFTNNSVTHISSSSSKMNFRENVDQNQHHQVNQVPPQIWLQDVLRHPPPYPMIGESF